MPNAQLVPPVSGGPLMALADGLRFQPWQVRTHTTHTLSYWTGFEPIHKHFIWENRDAREITMLPKSWQSLQDLLEPMCIQDPKNSVQTAWRIVVIPSLAINTLNASVTCRKPYAFDISRKVLQSDTVWCRKTVATWSNLYLYLVGGFNPSEKY